MGIEAHLPRPKKSEATIPSRLPPTLARQIARLVLLL
jgi:hypothetical protein